MLKIFGFVVWVDGGLLVELENGGGRIGNRSGVVDGFGFGYVELNLYCLIY